LNGKGNNMDLNGKTALVTGGGSGIGLGVAKALARESCRVVICGRDEEKLQRAAASFDGDPPLLTHPCDVTDREAVNRLAAWVNDQIGPLDILVNSAGMNVVRRAMSELAPEDFDRILATNCTGFYNVLSAVLPQMRGRGGLVINISSIAGKRALEIAGPAYCAAKFGVSALGTAVGLEERKHGIRITNIYPGEVDTPILNDRPEPVPEKKKAKMVHPEDIGACVVAVAKLPDHVTVPELVITPLYQHYA